MAATEQERFLARMASLLGLNSVSQDVQQKMIDEGIDDASILLLNDSDLRELGFKMGERRIIMKWIVDQQQLSDADSPGPSSLSTSPSPDFSLPSPSCSTPSSSSSASSATMAVHSTHSANPSSKIFKNCAVFDILEARKQVTGSISGKVLAEKLKVDPVMTKNERTFFTMVIGRYLMEKCATPNYPTPDEKEDLCESIVSAFPFLKDDSPTGYAWLFNRATWTGVLEFYVRSRRANNQDIQTKWSSSSKKHKSPVLACDDVVDATRLMREQRPNPSNIKDLLLLMDKTRETRREWIESSKPSITEVLKRYPRLHDIPDAVCKEFKAVTGCDKRLQLEWLKIKQLVLAVATERTDMTDLLSSVTDDLDEYKKSETAFLSLIRMLPSPPLKGVKRPRLSPQAVTDYFFIDFQDNTVDSAVAEVTSKGVTQPVLLRVQSNYVIKADSTAIPIPDCSGFVEAVEFLFMTFFVFGVQYPSDLRIFYGFIEHMLGIRNTVGKSSTLSNFLRLLSSRRNSDAGPRQDI